MKIKLVYIISDVSLGGAQTLLFDIVNYLKHKDDLDITIIIINSGEFLKMFDESGIKYIDLKESGLFNRNILTKLKKILKEIKPDIVHTHLITADFYGRIAAKQAGVPVIYSTCHNYSFDKNEADINKLSILDLIDNFIISYSGSNLIAISEIVKKYLVNRNKSFEKKTEVIYNGIDVNKEQYKLGVTEIQNFRNKFNISKDDFLITILGRLTMQKGHVFFLDAIKDFLKEKKNVKVLILGEGELRSEIESQIVENDLSGYVFLMGFQQETEKFIEISDLICVPSLWEGFGLVIIEAMIKRKIVLASNVGGIAEIVEDNKTGFMFEVNNKKCFQEKINYIYDNSNKLELIKNNALELVKQKFNIWKNSELYYLSYLKKLAIINKDLI
ncbi:MAG: glycosyltransferase family 4 protein [Ignavibacteria bacterium]